MAHKTYIKDTNGKTAVLFIHGFLGSPEHFEDLIQLVPEQYAIYNILLKGHGGTVLDFARTSMEEWKEQVHSTVTELSQKYKDIIICAHSMGTFFAMEEAIKNPGLVKALFLLATPLQIFVKPYAFTNTCKSFFNLMSENDRVAMAYQKAHSVQLNKRIWEYIGWIPRYLELFKESKRARATIMRVKVPTRVILSKKDELVSVHSAKYVIGNSNIKLHILPGSAHFIYSDQDLISMQNEFCTLVDEIYTENNLTNVE